MRIDEIASNASIEKTNNPKTWQFFKNLRNFANLLILKFDNSQTFEIFTISKIIEFS